MMLFHTIIRKQLFPEVFFSTARMSDAQFGAFMRAVFGYRFTGAVYEGDDLAVDIAFRTVQSQIDRYIEVCKTNQDNASNKNNGEGAAELSGMQGNPAKPNEEKGNAPHTHTLTHSSGDKLFSVVHFAARFLRCQIPAGTTKKPPKQKALRPPAPAVFRIGHNRR